MGRRIVRVLDPEPPSSWPDWVLAFSGGYSPADEARQHEAFVRFRRWQERRRRWFNDRGMALDWLACYREGRRRATERTS